MMRIGDWHVPFTKDSTINRAIILNANENQPVFTGRDFQNLAREGFQWNVTVYACITLIMDDIAGVKWKLAKRRGSRITAIEDHPILDLLMSPNPVQKYTDFIKSYMGFYLISGNTYVEAVGNPTKPEDQGSILKTPPKELWVQRPDRMKIIPGKQSTLVGKYEYDIGWSKIQYDPSRFYHRKTFNPTGDWYGLPPLEPAGLTVDVDNSARKWNLSLMQNFAKPAGILFTQGSLSTDQKQVIEQMFQMKFAGSANAGRVIVLEKNDKVGWQQVSMTPVDMDWKHSMDFNVVDICKTYKVPPELVGVAQSKTYNSFKEAKKAYYYQCILPHLDDIKNGWNEWLVPWFGDNIFLDYDRDDIEAIQDDRQIVFDMAMKGFTNGLFTANEARSLMKYPPTNDGFGDVRIISHSGMPVNDLGDEGDYNNGPSILNQQKFDQIKLSNKVTLFMPKSFDKAVNYKAKCFNLKTVNQKQAYWLSFETQRRSWERKVAGIATRALKADYKDIANQIRRTQSFDHARIIINNLPHEVRNEWLHQLGNIYSAVIPDFGRRTIRELLTDQKDDPIYWPTAVQDYITQYGAQKVTSITNTTKDDLRDILDEGFVKGDSLSTIADNIDAASEDLDGRGYVIARTEIGSASNYGSYQGAQATGLDLEKGWLTSEDDRVRESHADIDQEFVAMDDSFDNGLQFPGDPAGDPGEIVNCRCTIIYQDSKRGDDQ